MNDLFSELWNYQGHPKEGEDARCLCTIDQDEMCYVGIAYWAHIDKRWMQGNSPVIGHVRAWQKLPIPANGYWVHGQLVCADSKQEARVKHAMGEVP